jgi:DNA-binding NarL/FixJ family response regulator
MMAMETKALKCVLLANRHLGLTEGVRGLLETVADTVVMVGDEASLFESAGRLQPTLAVVDLSLIHDKHLRWLPRLRARCPSMKLIVISVHDEPNVCRATLAAGADGYVVKCDLGMELLAAVDTVMAGGPYPSVNPANQPGTGEDPPKT